VEINSGISADAAWNVAVDRCRWLVLRPHAAGQASLMTMTKQFLSNHCV